MSVHVDGLGMSRVGLVQDVFGDWVEPVSSYAPPECRSIVITDEIRAEDAAKIAAREAAAVDAWPIRRELSMENLRTRPRKPTPGRLVVKPAARVVVVPVVVVVETVLEVEEEREIEMETKRLCAVSTCEKEVGETNKSGRCSAHWFVKRGTPMCDGTIWPGAKGAKPAKAAKQGVMAKAASFLDESGLKVAPAPVLVVRTSSLPELVAAEGMVMLPVPIAALDRLLLGLAIADKVRILSAELAR